MDGHGQMNKKKFIILTSIISLSALVLSIVLIIGIKRYKVLSVSREKVEARKKRIQNRAMRRLNQAKNYKQKRRAIASLARTGGREAIATLVAVIISEEDETIVQGQTIVGGAAAGLREIFEKTKDSRIPNILIKVLEDSSDSRTRVRIIKSLKWIKTRQTMKVLRKIAKDDSNLEVRRAAEESLKFLRIRY